MNKILALLLITLACFTPDSLCAAGTNPSDANIVGHVVEKGNHEHLVRFTIRLLGTSIGTATDFMVFGYSTLRLTAGMQNIFNSYQSDFDRGSLRDSGYIYGPALPRSFYAAIALQL